MVSASFSAEYVEIFICISASAHDLSCSRTNFFFAASTPILVISTSAFFTFDSFSTAASLIIAVISFIPIASNLLFGSISATGVWFNIVIVTVSRLRPFSFKSGITISFTSSANLPLSF